MDRNDERLADRGRRFYLIAGLAQLDHGQALFDEIRDRLAKAEKKLRTRPRINAEDVKADIRYVMGQIAAYEEVLGLPSVVAKEVQGIEKIFRE